MERVRLALLLTSSALFLHGLVKAWRDQNSRGKARSSDIMGAQASRREARLKAVQVFLESTIWGFYICSICSIAGISITRILLVPSVAAVIFGWVSREVVSNMISGLVLLLTQPFAQGDWVTLDGGVDGWVQGTNAFYTRVMQWDKRPIYVPNSKVVSMNVQNNSRMTNRRIEYTFNLRHRDIPVVPLVVQELQKMIEAHGEVDPLQHRLVRWRSVDDNAASIWLSCYTQPTLEGIMLRKFTQVQQSVLERSCAIIYKNGAELVNRFDRYSRREGAPPAMEGTAPPSGYEEHQRSQEALGVREQVLWQRELRLNQDQKRLEEEENEFLAHRREASRLFGIVGEVDRGVPEEIPVREMGD